VVEEPQASQMSTTDSGSAADAIIGSRKSEEERKALLARTVTNEVARGWRVESQSDYQAVLLKGKKTSHGLHLFLSIITAGLWLIVWAIMVFVVNKERREVIGVDEYGNSNVSRV
jgi:hypothetical protein